MYVYFFYILTLANFKTSGSKIFYLIMDMPIWGESANIANAGATVNVATCSIRNIWVSNCSKTPIEIQTHEALFVLF